MYPESNILNFYPVAIFLTYKVCSAQIHNGRLFTLNSIRTSVRQQSVNYNYCLYSNPPGRETQRNVSSDKFFF